MASVILRSVGAAAGNMLLPGIGGGLLGSLGGNIGGSIDGQLGIGTHITGPRLENLNVQDSRYGAGIPIIYGNTRVAGNVIWSTDLIETEHNNNFSGGKGGAIGSSTSTTTYTYSVHCAVGIAAGPVGSITTIWADSTIIYQNGIWTSGIVDAANIYLGSTTQNPDAFVQSILGSGNVPAYRGLAYIVFENFQLASFGNRLPNLTFEIAPAPVSANPVLQGTVDVQIDQSQLAGRCGGMLPITLSSSSSEVQTVLVGGYANPGSSCVFEVVEYDVTDTTPVEIARYQSTSFAASSPTDSSWAMAPDGRFIAMYMQNSGSNSHNFVIFDTETQQFGSVYTVNLSNASSGTKQIAWVDAQHFLIDDCSGTHRGLHVFMRAGMSVIDLGFVDIWGAGTVTNYNNFYYSQFTPFAGGLLNYVWDVSTPNTLTLYVRPLLWQNNALSVGAAYTLVSGISLTVASGWHGTMLQTASGEWTLFFGNTINFAMFSFVPGLTSATITRSWQVFTPGFGNSLACFPVFYGDRIVVLQRGTVDSYYRLSEVTLNSGSFTRVLDGALSSGSFAVSNDFSAMALDTSRMLVLGVGGFSWDIGQLAIMQRCLTGASLTAILTDIFTRAGYAGGDYDVSALSGISTDGYVIQEPMTARSAIEPLQLFSPFDVVESGTQLKAVLRHGTADTSLPASEWRAAPDHQDPPAAMDVVRTQELDLPMEINIDYIDASRDFEVNSQRARRMVTKAQAVQKVALPIVCTSSAAKQIAETRLYTVWAERELVRLYVSRRYLALDPGDVVDLGNGSLLRVAKVLQSSSLMEIEGFYVTPATLSSTASADNGQFASPSTVAPLNSSLYLMDLPLLQNSDDQPGVYVAVSGLPGWTGASLWRAADGVNYSRIATMPIMATTGIAVTTPQNLPTTYIDNASSVQVQLMNGTLSSCSATDLYNGANAALLGNEIIQFQTATLTGPGYYTLTGLLRGRRGTEYATGSHVAGENFVLLTSTVLQFLPALLTDRGSTYEFRALTRGQSLGNVQDTNFTYNLNSIQPFAPVNIQGTRASGTGSDLTLVWKRRARMNAEWVSNIDVPLDESAELYDVEIMNGGSVIRTFSSQTSPTVTYTTAQQTADWGSVPATFTVNIYQLSSRYGRGRAATAVV